MKPVLEPKESLTPRQKRVFAASYLVVFLVFVGFLGSLWITMRPRETTTKLVTAQKSTKVVTKLARGTNGTATLISDVPFTGTPPYTYMIYRGNTMVWNNTSSAFPPNDYKGDSSGNVSVAANASAANYELITWSDNVGSTWREKHFAFEVVCATVGVSFGKPVWNSTTKKFDVTATVKASPAGSYTYAWKGNGSDATKTFSGAPGAKVNASVVAIMKGCAAEGKASITLPPR